MSEKAPTASPPPRPDDLPPEAIGEEDLLQDLRNLIVTDESESIKTMLSIVSSLQARIEDREGLIALLKPVIAAAVRESVEENPDELKGILAPIVSDIIRRGPGQSAPADRFSRSRVRAALTALKKRALTLFSPGPASPQSPPVVEEPPAERSGPELCDADFALLEVFLLARPSMVLLAHGSWQAGHLQSRTEEQILPLLRRFIRMKTEEQKLSGSLRARFEPYHILVEPAKYAFLVVLYEGSPPVGFFLDARQTLVDAHERFTDALRRAQAIQPYRGVLRLLLDRYRPTRCRIGAQSQEDPLKWPPPGTSLVTHS